MNNDSAPRPSGLIGGPALELLTEATLTAGFASAARLKSVGWLHATPMALWDEQHDRITIPVVIGSMPMPTLGRGFFVSIRSWNWNTDKPRFEVTAHAEDMKAMDVVFGPWNGVTVDSRADGGPPTPQQAVQMLSARDITRNNVGRRTKSTRKKRHR